MALQTVQDTGTLLSSTNRVEVPFIKVTIGEYVFGVYQNSSGSTNRAETQYPNYIQNMSVKKTNGVVNQYTLNIAYPITENDDPNFFEKVFSSVSNTRSIKFTYGDYMIPEYIYREEEGIITKVNTAFSIKSSVINYSIEAVSTSSLTLSGSYIFPSVTCKPSDKIIEVLYNPLYNLTEVFRGMKDYGLVEKVGLISQTDAMVKIPTQTNISALDYISFLVSCMRPAGSSGVIKSGIYNLTTYEDTSGEFGGPYFRVQEMSSGSSSMNNLCTYSVDIGYPDSTVVTNFNIKNNENWSIYYDYNQSISGDYKNRIDSKGELTKIYSPQLTNTQFQLTEKDSTWWTKVTQYPTTIEITIKGLLKPAILMQYVKLNTWFWGHKHISSGYYIITSQVDNIGLNGYSTTLTMLRVSEDNELV